MTPQGDARKTALTASDLGASDAVTFENVLKAFRFPELSALEWKLVNKYGLGAQIQPAFKVLSPGTAQLSNGIVLKARK